MNILSFIEPITEGVRKQFCGTTLLKPYRNWLNKLTLCDVDQSKIMLEGQVVLTQQTGSGIFSDPNLNHPISIKVGEEDRQKPN